jgi:hypothetical protein
MNVIVNSELYVIIAPLLVVFLNDCLHSACLKGKVAVNYPASIAFTRKN